MHPFMTVCVAFVVVNDKNLINIISTFINTILLWEENHFFGQWCYAHLLPRVPLTTQLTTPTSPTPLVKHSRVTTIAPQVHPTSCAILSPSRWPRLTRNLTSGSNIKNTPYMKQKLLFWVALATMLVTGALISHLTDMYAVLPRGEYPAFSVFSMSYFCCHIFLMSYIYS